MKIEIKPFDEGCIPQAGALLAARHKRNRADFPLLPERFEDPAMAEKAVTALWSKKLKNGYAAFRNGKMTAYIIGEYMVNPWGRCGYVQLPGLALAKDENATVLQDLYARLGDDWVKLGVFSHSAYVSAFDRQVMEGFFNMGFGKERVDAMLDLRTLESPKLNVPAGLTIRQAGKGDNAHAAGFSHLIAAALASAPYWHPTVPEDLPELKEGWAELPDEKDWKVWLALENDSALSMNGFTAKKEDDADLLAAPKTAYLSVAATSPIARGRGIANLLTWHGLNEARENGFEICYTNWISPNFLAARYWPRFGFKDVAYRLSKQVNPMVAWTRGVISGQ